MAAENGKSRKAQPGKAILALDGGGIRGVISVAILEKIEQLHRERLGAEMTLSERFDLIGGTSTGAIIATALALGLATADIKTLYFELAPRVFRRSRTRLAFIQTLFDEAALREEIFKVVGDRRLDTPDLRTALAVITKRMDTGGAWLVSNNPGGKFWEDPEDGSFIGNRNYLLADLVRASTAAPYYFKPQFIQIAEGAPPGLFIDGGITPHNNPALALLMLATIPAYGFGWPTGADQLRVISVGTGARRDRMSASAARRMPAAGLAIHALTSMVTDFEQPGADGDAGAWPERCTLGHQFGDRRPRRLSPDKRAVVHLPALRRATRPRLAPRRAGDEAQRRGRRRARQAGQQRRGTACLRDRAGGGREIRPAVAFRAVDRAGRLRLHDRERTGGRHRYGRRPTNAFAGSM